MCVSPPAEPPVWAQGALWALRGLCAGGRPGGVPLLSQPWFLFPHPFSPFTHCSLSRASSLYRELLPRPWAFWGAVLALHPQQGLAQPPAHPSLLQTRVSPRHLQWCRFTLGLEGLDDAVALLYPLFLMMVVVVRWLRASREWAGKGQQQAAGARNGIEHGSRCVLWRPNLFIDQWSLDVLHTISPEPSVYPRRYQHLLYKEKKKKKSPPCL